MNGGTTLRPMLLLYLAAALLLFSHLSKAGYFAG